MPKLVEFCGVQKATSGGLGPLESDYRSGRANRNSWTLRLTQAGTA